MKNYWNGQRSENNEQMNGRDPRKGDRKLPVSRLYVVGGYMAMRSIVSRKR
jgi:hypothetical protein